MFTSGSSSSSSSPDNSDPSVSYSISTSSSSLIGDLGSDSDPPVDPRLKLGVGEPRVEVKVWLVGNMSAVSVFMFAVGIGIEDRESMPGGGNG